MNLIFALFLSWIGSNTFAMTPMLECAQGQSSIYYGGYVNGLEQSRIGSVSSFETERTFDNRMNMLIWMNDGHLDAEVFEFLRFEWVKTEPYQTLHPEVPNSKNRNYWNRTYSIFRVKKGKYVEGQGWVVSEVNPPQPIVINEMFSCIEYLKISSIENELRKNYSNK